MNVMWCKWGVPTSVQLGERTVGGIDRKVWIDDRVVGVGMFIVTVVPRKFHLPLAAPGEEGAEDVEPYPASCGSPP